MKTVLELVKAACYECNLPAPTALYNGTTQSVLHRLNLLYAIARDLRSTRAFPQQKKTGTITLSSGRAAYPLPEDFYAGLLGTQINQTENWELVGPVADSTWNYWLYGPGYGSTRTAYRVFGPDFNQNTAGGQFKVQDTPTATQTVSFDYVSANLFLPPHWTPSTAGIVLNSFRNANGNIYKATAVSGSATTGTTAPSHTSGTAIDNAGANQITWTYISAPYETIQSDSDLCIFDDDVMIDGWRYRHREARGLDFAEPIQAYRSKIANSRARWVGSFKGCLSRTKNTPQRYTIADGPGGWPI